MPPLRRMLAGLLVLGIGFGMCYLYLTGSLVKPWGRAYPRFLGVAEFYDGRACAVAATIDDFADWGMANCIHMVNNFSSREIWLTGCIITEQACNSWDRIQRFVDTGFFEPASHSATHPSIPYADYAYQIQRSREHIMGNLTMPEVMRNEAGGEYLWAWIRPRSQGDQAQRELCGEAGYLADRDTSTDTGWSSWDRRNGLYEPLGIKGYIQDAWGGTSSVETLNSYFDAAYAAGELYTIYTHPNTGNQTALYAHLDHIAGNTSVWFTGWGAAHAYHRAQEQGIARVKASGTGDERWFEIAARPEDHEKYGLTYPVTYVFALDPSWQGGWVAEARRNATQAWARLPAKESTDLFNGVQCARIDHAQSKAYVSVAFDAWNHQVQIRLQKTSQQ